MYADNECSLIENDGDVEEVNELVDAVEVMVEAGQLLELQIHAAQEPELGPEMVPAVHDDVVAHQPQLVAEEQDVQSLNEPREY